MMMRNLFADASDRLKSRELADCEWTVIDILKGSESAKAILGFKYITEEDDIEGTIELTLIKEDEEESNEHDNRFFG